jgi:SAM-dependent methyltransferase
MPYSYSLFKEDVKKSIVDYFPADIKILDVGCGSGTYADLLRNDFPFIDGIEIFPEYVKSFDLLMKYRRVFIDDIRNFDISMYDLIIMGDILEHLSQANAINLIDKINAHGINLLVAVPYLYEQGEMYGNPNEAHLQPDLTPEIMSARYPSLSLLFGDDKYGYYINY